jgi:hypothetical protein
MSNALTIALAAATALIVVGGVLWVSLRMTDHKALQNARGVTTGAPALGNEWVALNGDVGGADCGGPDSSGGCD